MKKNFLTLYSTAKHCNFDVDKDEIVLGTHYRTRDISEFYINGEVVIDHPRTQRAKSGMQLYDITMIKTERDIEFSSAIRPACLPTGPPDITKVLNLKFTVN